MDTEIQLEWAYVVGVALRTFLVILVDASRYAKSTFQYFLPCARIRSGLFLEAYWNLQIVNQST